MGRTRSGTSGTGPGYPVRAGAPAWLRETWQNGVFSRWIALQTHTPNMSPAAMSRSNSPGCLMQVYRGGGSFGGMQKKPNAGSGAATGIERIIRFPPPFSFFLTHRVSARGHAGSCELRDWSPQSSTWTAIRSHECCLENTLGWTQHR